MARLHPGMRAEGLPARALDAGATLQAHFAGDFDPGFTRNSLARGACVFLLASLLKPILPAFEKMLAGKAAGLAMERLGKGHLDNDTRLAADVPGRGDRSTAAGFQPRDAADVPARALLDSGLTRLGLARRLLKSRFASLRLWRARLDPALAWLTFIGRGLKPGGTGLRAWLADLEARGASEKLRVRGLQPCFAGLRLCLRGLQPSLTSLSLRVGFL